MIGLTTPAGRTFKTARDNQEKEQERMLLLFLSLLQEEQQHLGVKSTVHQLGLCNNDATKKVQNGLNCYNGCSKQAQSC